MVARATHASHPWLPRSPNATSACSSGSGKQEAILQCEELTMDLESSLTPVDVGDDKTGPCGPRKMLEITLFVAVIIPGIGR